ncbi:hypothetical protein jhhlp_006346 [Lomentospora prolificans]|uniref:Exonuclease domain-containing protein n=1 Tax=Lomentospora prolificans TaxID=41688 RepID=A0A2N3N5N2_9PEZI|nr:hypothetical protein jhhlp_006346 [Lomentospora prolificans]
MDATVLLSLKKIPCPKKDKCPNVDCLFQHPRELTSTTSDNSGAESNAEISDRKRKDDSEAGNPEPPKKRVRSGEEGRDDAQNQSALVQAVSRKSIPTKPDEAKPKSLERSVSPPGLKRKSGCLPLDKFQGSPKPSAASQIKLASHQPSSTSASGTHTGPAPPVKKSAKPEALNPRMVAKPPAKFETRLKLLKLVHTELTRLNDNLKKSEQVDKSQSAAAADSVAGASKAVTNGGPDKKASGMALSDQERILVALEEEEKAALDKPDIYTTAMRNTYMKYKRMTVEQWREFCSSKKNAEKSACNPTDGAKPVITGLTPTQEVVILRRLLTPIDNLSKHGYVSSIPSTEDIVNARTVAKMLQGWEKCARCDRRFQVFPGRREEDGALTSGGVCVHHPGKTYFQDRQPGDKSKQLKRYKCCGEAVGDSSGCTRGDTHVFKVSDVKMLASIINFAETPENEKPHGYPVCFDCEMGYTVYGLEVIRVTATSWPSGEVLLDVLVRPKGEVLDLNSRYSGVFPEDMVEAEPYSGYDPENPPLPTEIPTTSEDATRRKYKIVGSPEAARELFFSLISPSTPLIGHGLENDLNALRVVHPTLVDTILLYPHKQGLPYRMGLKMLAAHHLGMKIQVEEPGSIRGHDSAEDARASGELARLKVKGEWDRLKLEGWSIVHGDIVPPP